MGTYRGTVAEAWQVVEAMKPMWLGTQYDLLERNCNHFSSAATSRLVSRPIPSWVNRLAGLGDTWCSIFGRPSALGEAPEVVAAQEDQDEGQPSPSGVQRDGLLGQARVQGVLGLRNKDKTEWTHHWCSISQGSPCMFVIMPGLTSTGARPEFEMEVTGAEGLEEENTFVITSQKHQIACRARNSSQMWAWLDSCRLLRLERESSGRQLPAGQPWSCPDCTFHNPAHAQVCEVCLRPRPGRPSPTAARLPDYEEAMEQMSSTGLPPDWAEQYDPVNDQTFYLNLSTGQRQAERPGTEPAPAPWQCEVCTYSNKPDAARCAMCGADKPLPAGWVEKLDPINKRPYWVNTQTSKVSSTRPTSAPPPEPAKPAVRRVGPAGKWRVDAPNGIAWRMSADFDDRVTAMRGPKFGEVLHVDCTVEAGGVLFVQCGEMFLPVRDRSGKHPNLVEEDTRSRPMQRGHPMQRSLDHDVSRVQQQRQSNPPPRTKVPDPVWV